MKRLRILFSDAELLRTAPVLWSLNLHQLPKRVFGFLMVSLVVAVLLWIRSPRVHPLEVVMFGVMLTLVVLALVGPAELLPNEGLVLDGHSIRIVSLLLLVGYFGMFEWLRREGEKMRALPRLVDPEN